MTLSLAGNGITLVSCYLSAQIRARGACLHAKAEAIIDLGQATARDRVLEPYTTLKLCTEERGVAGPLVL